MMRHSKELFLWVLGVLVCSLLVVLAYIGMYRFIRTPVVNIAVVAPLSGPNKLSGQEMLKGIRLYLETVRQEKLLPDMRIKILPFDDGNDPQEAEKVAQKIVNETETVLVIGHFSEETSLAAGKLYKKSRLPAITASAALESITAENDWYFRIFQSSSLQAAFIANYVKYVFKDQAVSMIFENSLYGKALAEDFEQSSRLIGLDIRMKKGLYPKRDNFEKQVDMLVQQIQKIGDPGVIFVAMRPPEALPVIMALQSQEKRYAIIGPDAFATSAMQRALKQAADESGQPPGYYTDGIYAIAPFMIDTANHQAQVFKEHYAQIYPWESVSWLSAMYYDAMAVAVKAVSQADLEGQGHPRGDRQKIRDTLIGYYDEKTSVRGITGKIYFDSSGNTGNPPVVGVFHRQRLLPASTQYQANQRTYTNPFERVLRGELMVINQQQMAQTQVVYTNIHINHISDIDLKDPRYTIDFYLWFRFQQDFDDADIVFANALTPITLGEPIIEQTSPELTTHIYHIVAEFTQNFNFQGYPFDQQVLPITFQHASLTQENLMYVSDPFGLPEIVQQNIDPATPLTHELQGWKIAEKWTSQDVISHLSSLGNPEYFEDEHTIDASQFSVNVRVKRSELSFYVEAFFPILILLILLSSAFTVFSIDRLRLRLAVYIGLFMVTAFYHIRVLLELPEEYMIPIDYAYFAIYAMLLGSMYLSVTGYALYRRRLELLQNIYLFRPFPDAMKSQICKRMRRRRYKKPNKTIIQQGDEGDSLFLMIQGKAIAWIDLDDGSSLEVNAFTPGDFFGEMALLTGEKRSAHVTTTTPAVIGEITKANIAPFLAKHPEIAMTMSEELVQRKIREMKRKDNIQAHLVNRREMAENYSSTIRQFFSI